MPAVVDLTGLELGSEKINVLSYTKAAADALITQTVRCFAAYVKRREQRHSVHL